jgi:hypothetical protein
MILMTPELPVSGVISYGKQTPWILTERAWNAPSSWPGLADAPPLMISSNV